MRSLIDEPPEHRRAVVHLHAPAVGSADQTLVATTAAAPTGFSVTSVRTFSVQVTTAVSPTTLTCTSVRKNWM